MLQREFVSGWRTVSIALKELSNGSPAASRRLLRTLTKAGPIRLLKLLKLSLWETGRLRQKRIDLTRSIVALDKIAQLTFSYSGRLLNSDGAAAISSSEKATLRRVARWQSPRGPNLWSSHCEPRPKNAPSVIIAGVRGARPMSMLSDDGICMNTPVAIIARDLAEVTYKRRQNLFKGIFLR
jgi:hypothetical protein